MFRLLKATFQIHRFLCVILHIWFLPIIAPKIRLIILLSIFFFAILDKLIQQSLKVTFRSIALPKLGKDLGSDGKCQW